MTPKMLASSLVLAALLAACGGAGSARGPVVLPLLSSGAQSPSSGAQRAETAYPQSAGGVDYRLGPSVPGLAMDARGYRMTSSASSARVARLAAALGLRGPVTVDRSGWSVSGAGEALRVQRAGGLPWTLSSASPVGVSVSGCAVAAPGVTTGAGGTSASDPARAVPTERGRLPICPPSKAVAGLPSSTDAIKRAQAALVAAGLDLRGATTTVSGGSTQWDVTIDLAVAGVSVVGSPLSVSVGAQGRIQAASGWVPDVAASSDYRLAGVAAGVQRLQQGGPWILQGGPAATPMIQPLRVPQGGPAPISVIPPATEGTGTAAVPAPGPVTCTPGGACAAPGSPPAASGATTPPGPASVTTVTGARLALGWAWPADDPSSAAWLLPIYQFVVGAGETVPVLAVADRQLTLRSPVRALPASLPALKGKGEPSTAPTVSPAIAPRGL